ncbi:unnamed protein product [Durusdinium trenchii]|uniref:Poly [ADP-ribose] polymerase n=2 Tax=Durusdinium trenchii TaxID=1381693 RepID=A0ABP0R859_9DINO
MKQLIDELKAKKHHLRREYRAASQSLADKSRECQRLTKDLSAAHKQIHKLRRQLAQKHIFHNSACWQYWDNEHWNDVPRDGSMQMQEAYLFYLDNPEANRWARIKSVGVERLVDFEAMTQERCDTKRRRSIRILPEVPKQWESPPSRLFLQGDTPFKVQVIEPHVLRQVQKILALTGHASSQKCSCMRTATVQSVHRIEHLRLWRAYRTRREALKEQNKSFNVRVTPAALQLHLLASEKANDVMTRSQQVLDGGEPLELDVDEKILLHGTSLENARSIVRNGFDHRTCSGSSMYGDGVYFASAACKSNQYSKEKDNVKTLIIARVTLGDAYHAKKTLYEERRPPVRSKLGSTYDSVVVNPGPIAGHHQSQQFHQEFVIFDREQAYPFYVVKYCL